MPPQVAAAIREQADDFARYPDPHCRLLGEALSAHEEVDESMIVCGNGAADLLFRLCHGLKPRAVLIAAPAFSEYERAAKEAGAEIHFYQLREDEHFAVPPRILAALRPGIDMLFLANPNNPTGRLIQAGLTREILRCCVETGTRLIMDECFLPFTDSRSDSGSMTALLPEAPASLVVVKALTKTFSLAGCRLGYLICADRALTGKVRDTGQSWSVSAPAQTAGIAALTCGDWFSRSKEALPEERAFLTESLRSLGLTVYDSDSNFLLFRLETPPEPSVKIESSIEPSIKPSTEPTLESRLLDRGFLIRSCANFRFLDRRYYRIAVRLPAENRALVAALREILQRPVSAEHEENGEHGS
jgi:threonine-phosphate decarboxylase